MWIGQGRLNLPVTMNGVILTTPRNKDTVMRTHVFVLDAPSSHPVNRFHLVEEIMI
ncbi:MAG: hypothetical protein ISS56_08105 [Anaerolineae bacterium]|nr:hypothetical protein [Anaerolineae bacterium]